MSVRGLGYIGLGVKDLDAWRRFSIDILGLEVRDDDDGSLRLRIDSRDWRIAVEPTGEEDIIYAGWELAGPAELAGLTDRLQAAGVAVTPDNGALAKKRGVLGVATAVDPAGMVCEFFWGATERLERPYLSPAGVSGFVAGNQGLGHMVITTPHLAQVNHFYQELLGFRLSDYIDMPVGPGMTIPVTFLHCNARHHSYAFAPGAPGNPTKLNHFMLQTQSLDDVGHALDRIAAHNVPLASGLGRHSNDLMVSFYAVTPSGFEVEFGFGAREVDDATWLPARHDKPSIWGHKAVPRQPRT